MDETSNGAIHGDAMGEACPNLTLKKDIPSAH